MTDCLQSVGVAFRNAHGLKDSGGTAGFTGQIPFDLFEFGRQHRILGLLEAGLDISSRLSAESADGWRRAIFGQASYSSYCTNEAEKLAPSLQAKLGPLLLLKGPSLAAQAWPDIALRHFDDLDFRIEKKRYHSLCEQMEATGYAPAVTDENRRRNLWRYGWGISFKNARGLILEFNHRFFPPQYPVPGSFSMQGIKHFDQKLDRVDVPTLSPSDHLIYSCLHALWHGWERLSWIMDIAGLIVRHPQSLSEARGTLPASGFARAALEAGVGISRAICGNDLPEETSGFLPRHYVNSVIERYRSGEKIVSFVEQRRMHYPLMTAGEKIECVARRILIPGDGDFRAVGLPTALSPLYWTLRPLRALLTRSH